MFIVCTAFYIPLQCLGSDMVSNITKVPKEMCASIFLTDGLEMKSMITPFNGGQSLQS